MLNHHEIEDAVYKAIQDAGIPVLKRPTLVPGLWSRFPTNNDPRDTAGSVQLFANCEGAYFSDFRSGLTGTWFAKAQETLTEAQREVMREKTKRARETQQRALSLARARAASKAASLASLAKQATDDHPYLIKKRVKAAPGLLELPAAAVHKHLGWWPNCRGDRLVGRLLLMPLRDLSGAISSIEFIDESGKKAALAQAQKAGRFFAIGALPVADSLRMLVHFAEGYATAASVHRVQGGCVLVCSSVGNFAEVITEARRRWPRARFVVCGDLNTSPDSRSEAQAREAAKHGRAACVFPDFGEPPSSDNNDFNDMANLLGDERTRQHIAAMIAEQLIGPDLTILDRRWETIPAPTQLTTAAGNTLPVLGSAASDWIDAEAKGRSAPIDYVFCGVLTACAGVIGMKRRIMLRPSWIEPCIVWLAIVGPPSVRKSPASDGLRPPLAAIEKRLDDGYRDAVAAYERDLAAYEEEVTTLKEARRSGAAPEGSEPKKPRKPPRPRLLINNATTEKIALMLSENPSGLLSIRDELAELIASFDRYSKGGGDKDFLLQAYGGRSYVADRVGRDEPVRIPRLAVSIVGGIVPDRLEALLLGGDNDGFGARFLYAVTDESRPVDLMEPGADPGVVGRMLDRLHGLAWSGPEAAPEPKDIPLCDEARDVFQKWLDAHHARKSAHYGFYGSALGKMDGQVGRLALIIEYIRWAESTSSNEPNSISADAMTAAVALMDQYFEPMLRRALGESALPKPERDAVRIARALLERRPAKINARNMRLTWRLHGIGKAEDFDKALEVLVELGWIRPAGEVTGPGRKPKDFDVAPEISGVPWPIKPEEKRRR